MGRPKRTLRAPGYQTRLEPGYLCLDPSSVQPLPFRPAELGARETRNQGRVELTVRTKDSTAIAFADRVALSLLSFRGELQ